MAMFIGNAMHLYLAPILEHLKILFEMFKVYLCNDVYTMVALQNPVVTCKVDPI